MPKANRNAGKAVKKASLAVSKRWLANQKSSCFIKTVATQTDLTKEKNCLPSKAADASLSSVQELVTFARNIPDLMASLPVSVVIDDESLSETTTNQLTGILHRYGHDLEKATTKKLQVLDANLCLTSSDFLVAAFESQVCEKCKRFEGLRVTSKTEVKAGVYAFDLVCRTCHAKSSRVSDSRIIESKFRPKSWLPNYVLLCFLLNGEYYKDYEHVLGTLGLAHLSKTQWQRVVKWVHPFVKKLADWSCSEVKRQIIRRGDQKNLKIMFDGFYLTRGFHANNASGTIHDEQTGRVLQFAHRSKRGHGSNWTGTSGGAEGDIFEELLTNLQKDSFDVKECVMDHDSRCANVLLEKFPEAEVVYCGNHTVKTFHSELENVKKTPCQVKSVQRR